MITLHVYNGILRKVSNNGVVIVEDKPTMDFTPLIPFVGQEAIYQSDEKVTYKIIRYVTKDFLSLVPSNNREVRLW